MKTPPVNAQGDNPETTSAPPFDATDTRLGGWTLGLVQAGWVVIATLSVVLYVASLPVTFEHLATVCSSSECGSQLTREGARELRELGLAAGFYAAWLIAAASFFTAFSCATAALLIWRRSAERMALFSATMLVTLGVAASLDPALLAQAHPGWQPFVGVVYFLGRTSLFVFLFLFPDGRFVPRWTWVLAVAALLFVGAESFWPGGAEGWPLALQLAPWFGFLLAGLAAQVYRYRRLSTPVQRQQTKWVAFGATVFVVGFLGLVALFALAAPSLQRDPLANLAGQTGIYLLLLIIPLSLASTILRHRLWDIDVVINRALVYAALTALVVGLYVLVVGYLGALLGFENNLLLSLVATGGVAVLFAPLKERIQRGVNRLMYGEREEPYSVLSLLGRRLEVTLSPEEVLPTVVESVARALRLPHVAVWLADGDTLRLGAAHGHTPPQTEVRDADAVKALRHAQDGLGLRELDPSGGYGEVLAKSGATLTLPLSHRGELVGALCVAPRGRGEDFSPADRALLRDLAAQSGSAAHAVRLTDALRASLEELRHSRERLIAAQEEERRRIQRDLHDGLGPVLASMRLRLEACLDEAQEAPESRTASPLFGDLERLYELVGEATADIRRLVYDLRPPVLDQLGLVPALRQHCEHFQRETGVEIGFEAEVGLSVPAGAEVAFLRIAQEALHNVDKHAGASRAEVRLARSDGRIALSVHDDGVGLGEPDQSQGGTGISSMRERAELLGGTLRVVSSDGPCGTEVTVSIPAGPPDGASHGEAAG